MQEQPEAARDKPDPEVVGYINIRHKDSEAKRIDFTVKYFADSWLKMGFEFRVDGDTAVIQTINPPGKKFNPAQSADARHEAIRQVTSLDFIEYVEMNPRGYQS